MYVVLISAAFAALALLAFLAYMAGERIRAEQRAAVAEYATRRTETLKRLRDVRRRQTLEAERRTQSEMKHTRDILAESADPNLAGDIAFVQRIAREAPHVIAAVIKKYVRDDPAVIAGAKRATDPADFE